MKSKEIFFFNFFKNTSKIQNLIPSEPALSWIVQSYKKIVTFLCLYMQDHFLFLKNNVLMLEIHQNK